MSRDLTGVAKPARQTPKPAAATTQITMSVSQTRLRLRRICAGMSSDRADLEAVTSLSGRFYRPSPAGARSADERGDAVIRIATPAGVGSPSASPRPYR
jgi:hypothetical protein